MLFFGGIIFGFNALYPVLKAEGIYSHVCNDSQLVVGCPEQTAVYGYAFTTYTVLQMVMLLVIGLAVDNIGLRTVKLCSASLFSLGALFFAFTSANQSWLLFPAGCCVAVGGMGLLICNFSISKLFTKASALVLALITGSYDSAATVFAVVSIAYEAGLSYKAIFLTISIVSLVLNTFSSFFILTANLADMSKFNTTQVLLVSTPEAGKLDGEDGESLGDNSTQIEKLKQEDSTGDDRTPITEDEQIANILHRRFPTVLKSLLSLPFMMGLLFFSCALLRFTFFLTQLGALSQFHLEHAEAVARMGRILSFVLGAGIIGGFCCGSTIDCLRAKFRPLISRALTAESSNSDGEVPVNESAVFWLLVSPQSVAMLVMILATTVSSCLVFVPREEAYYVHFFFLVIMRGFLFSTFASFLLTGFPLEYFGTLYGVSASLAGAFSCLQYALLQPNPNLANGIAFIFVALALILPIWVLSNAARALRRVAYGSKIGTNENLSAVCQL
ncbi:unnamed protein product [Dibothriocephalus latus]|uniref:Major facilitator superfamily (MFS) profile domain-containing protein n=1 Tax=Dibothriocephalus latus TaxID=60516 RepID=A0A3P7MKL6_DIBLA|nr:unnamed protein product [Dibothriocephalus latus]